MNTVDRLRPEHRALDAEWSATVLDSILSTPPGAPTAATDAPRRPRRSFRIATVLAGCAAVVCAVGLIGPFGSSGPSAAAAQLTAEHLSIHPDVGPDDYLHITRTERDWGNGGAGVMDPFTLEYWVPGDGVSKWIERSGTPGEVETHSFDDWGPKVYVDHSAEPSTLLAQLRDYAASQGEGRDLHGLWTVALWIVEDPVAPQSFKDEVMRALSTLKDVRVADDHFEATGLGGKALRIAGRYDPWFVVDPRTSAFHGIVGHPEKDDAWTGPEEPMWTVTFDSDVTDDAPCASLVCRIVSSR